MADDITISQITSSSDKYQAVWELREEILRKPLGLSLKNEDLGRDQIDTIMIAECAAELIACLMLQQKGDKVVQLRQMAVSNAWQGKGIGRQLVLAAEKYCSEQGYNKITLHARKVAVGFYRGLGYTVAGDEFTEVGIPHLMMEKNI